jgi:hypothetical protein
VSTSDPSDSGSSLGFCSAADPGDLQAEFDQDVTNNSSAADDMSGQCQSYCAQDSTCPAGAGTVFTDDSVAALLGEFGLDHATDLSVNGVATATCYDLNFTDTPTDEDKGVTQFHRWIARCTCP